MVGVKGNSSTTGTGGGEIVQVQGGHIIRATGRKDRHSKVFTAKGPRDRRVRLSAHTAIQFYDVQDRLGYDRPSKAVDWLIKKAKDSIDKLAELPPWDPSAASSAGAASDAVDHDQIHVGGHSGTSSYGVDSSQFLSADSMKSFFPITSNSGENPGMNFQNYPHEQQHLSLSLHTTLQGPGGENTNHQQQQHSSHEQTVFHESSGSMGFDGGWAEPSNHQDLGRFARLMGWSGGASPFPPPPQVAYNFQRGTLQSNNLFSPNLVQQINHNNHSSISSIGLGSEGGFMGFSIPSQIHGDHHRHHQLHGGSASMSNTNASSSSLSPDSSSQH